VQGYHSFASFWLTPVLSAPRRVFGRVLSLPKPSGKLNALARRPLHSARRPAVRAAFLAALTPRSSSPGILAGMDDLLDALHAFRPLWLPLLLPSLAATAGLGLIAWS
jgi:hypothetical protein